MSKIKLKAFDAADYLSEEDMQDYLQVALEDGDPKLLAAALGDIAKARGMAQLAAHRVVQRKPLQEFVGRASAQFRDAVQGDEGAGLQAVSAVRARLTTLPWRQPRHGCLRRASSGWRRCREPCRLGPGLRGYRGSGANAFSRGRGP